ncbi:hypothetical protein L873DRAFT_1785549 [Choiromyces venosus 120613-1]|uniref:Uncharacterized protein n=1 Tax=Choiromyces venosus 120613-1 TaxID=1336337 RepID=A0A3N4K5N9_9PEZI|nr:hypothetical protein L873DRAFT_1785549 [Choiromyces venosus 120613-1]
MELVFTSKFLLTLKTGISIPRCSLVLIKYVPETPRCQLSNTTSHILLASVPAELQATMEMVFTSEFLLTLKTDISMPRCSPVPIRYVPESPRCQHYNAASHVLLASVSPELQATMEMIFTSEFLLTLKTDISTPRCLLMLIRHVLKSPRCQPFSATSYVLLTSVPTELQAAIEIVFTSQFLLTLKTDISTPSHLPMPIRCVSESPQCQRSNGASYVLLASVSTELQVAIEIVFTSKFLLNLKTVISTPSHSLVSIRYVLEFPQCHLSNSTFYILLASVSVKLQATIEMVFTGEFLLTLKTDISMLRCSLMPIGHVQESP